MKKHRPRDPNAVYIPIDTGTGVVIYGKVERYMDVPCCDGEINPYTGEPYDTTPAVIRPLTNDDPYQ